MRHAANDNTRDDTTTARRLGFCLILLSGSVMIHLIYMVGEWLGAVQ